MKKLILLAITGFVAVTGKAQLSPVTWTFTAKKTSDKTYEVHMKATLQSGWHLYSQTQPADAIAIPTGFIINANPLLTLDGKIKELGKEEKFHDAKLKVSANQFSGSVDFVQLVKLKAKVKTSLTGSVEFQTCNDEKCLPPKTTNFNIPIQ